MIKGTKTIENVYALTNTLDKVGAHLYLHVRHGIELCKNCFIILTLAKDECQIRKFCKLDSTKRYCS